MMKSISQWQREIHGLAIEKGWYEGEPKSTLEQLALIMSELGEAVNEVRVENAPVYFKCKITGKSLPLDKVNQGVIGFDHWKPEGVAVELADAIIRALDFADHCGWNMEQIIQLKHNFNKTRPHRHGGKKY